MSGAARFRSEAADLLFHLPVLFEAKGIPLDDVLATLREHHR
ncbi:phosphoribosyl-ATP pyrophosphatase [Rhodocaloribacter sp.]